MPGIFVIHNMCVERGSSNRTVSENNKINLCESGLTLYFYKSYKIHARMQKCLKLHDMCADQCLCSAPAILSHRPSDGPRIILAKPFIYFSETFQNFFVIFAECWQPVWQCESAVRRANERDKKSERARERTQSAGGQWRMKIHIYVCPAAPRERGNKTRG